VTNRMGRSRVILITTAFVLSNILAVLYGLTAAKYKLFPYPQVQKVYGFATGRAKKNAGPPHGRWTVLGSTEETDHSEEMKALPYLQGSRPASGMSGVNLYKASLTSSGLNLVVSADAPEAFLMDMDGKIVHRWISPKDQVDIPKGHEKDTYWRRVHLYPNGDIAVIYENSGILAKLDKDSHVLWKVRLAAHHDLDVADDGTIHVLTRLYHKMPGIHPTKPVLEDFITVVDPSGKVIRKVSLLQAIDSSLYRSLLQPIRILNRYGDITHTNTLEVIRSPRPGLPPAFQAGNWLVSFSQLHTVAIVSKDTGQLVWAMSGLWAFQHQPTLLPEGNLLVFDNRGGIFGSRVMEVEPTTQTVVWKYEGTPDAPFFTATTGSCQRLRNGNTLITETESGRAFEVTPAGERVWEWRSPLRYRNYVAWLCEMVRIEDVDQLWLGGRFPAHHEGIRTIKQ